MAPGPEVYGQAGPEREFCGNAALDREHLKGEAREPGVGGDLSLNSEASEPRTEDQSGLYFLPLHRWVRWRHRACWERPALTHLDPCRPAEPVPP